MPKTSLVERKKGHATTYKKSKPRVHIRKVDAKKIRTELEARRTAGQNLTRDELWEIRREAGLYGLFAGDPFKREYMGGKRTRRISH